MTIKVKRIIEELKFGIYKVRFFTSLLGASIVYLISYLILMLISLPPISISLIISILFFISEMVAFSKKNPLLQIEEKYSEIDEELRTVYDNYKKDNELIQNLKEEVRRKVKKIVDMSDFVDFKKVMSRTLMLFLMSFLIILIASLNIKIMNMNEIVDTTGDLYKDLTLKLLGSNNDVEVANSDQTLMNKFRKLATTVGIAGGDQESGEIFGETKIVQLGNEKINIEIRPTDYELSIDDYIKPEKQDFISKPFEDEVFFEKSYALEENIPQKKQEIVKRYFKELSKT